MDPCQKFHGNMKNTFRTIINILGKTEAKGDEWYGSVPHMFISPELNLVDISSLIIKCLTSKSYIHKE